MIWEIFDAAIATENAQFQIWMDSDYSWTTNISYISTTNISYISTTNIFEYFLGLDKKCG